MAEPVALLLAALTAAALICIVQPYKLEFRLCPLAFWSFFE